MKKRNGFVKFLAIIACLAAIGAVAYAVYRFFTPDYLDDFEDDFDDDFDDYFEAAPEDVKTVTAEPKEEAAPEPEAAGA